MPKAVGKSRTPLPVREACFEALTRMAGLCVACPRMGGRKRVLGPLNGAAGAKALFLAEAPGRNGADRTGVPIHGDPTGVNFEALLKRAGWRREDVFITNAVLCNPRGPDGNNDSPSREEVENCSFWLDQTIKVVGPKAVITLGAVALQALELIEPHGLRLKSAVGIPVPWDRVWLVPLYHPGPRAILHRPFEKQAADFVRLRAFVDTL